MNTTPSSRIALVTGAAGGLGRAFALRLAAGGQALALACDLADTADVRRFAAEVLTLAGRIEVLVNNAAFMPMVPLATLSAALWRQIMTVNVDAPLFAGTGVFSRHGRAPLGSHRQSGVQHGVGPTAGHECLRVPARWA